jgi:hypothetical protein
VARVITLVTVGVPKPYTLHVVKNARDVLVNVMILLYLQDLQDLQAQSLSTPIWQGLRALELSTVSRNRAVQLGNASKSTLTSFQHCIHESMPDANTRKHLTDHESAGARIRLAEVGCDEARRDLHVTQKRVWSAIAKRREEH